jgi:hypothetical protein
MSKIQLQELEYTRQILNIGTIDLPGYPGTVKWVNWTMKGEDEDGFEVESQFSTNLNFLDIQQDFIPLESLSDEIIFGWIEQLLGEEYFNTFAKESVRLHYLLIKYPNNTFSYETFPWNN